MNRLASAGLVGLALLATACSGGATPSASPSERPAATPATIAVTLLDALKIEPATIEAPIGVEVTFVVKNAGSTDHEFVVGDVAVQDDHEMEMQVMGAGMMHDEPNAVIVHPGETKELRMTFAAAGATLAGCHFPGHYLGGMKATINLGG